MPNDDVIIEFLDDGEVVGTESASTSTIELWIEEKAEAKEVPVTEYFEFDDGRGPAGPPGPAGPQNLILLAPGEEPDPETTPDRAIIYEMG